MDTNNGNSNGNKPKKERNDIFTKIDNILVNFLDGYPQVYLTIARIVVYGGMILIAIGIIQAASKVLAPLLINVLSGIVTLVLILVIGFFVIGGFIYDVKLQMTRDENSFLLNERLKYQKKEYEERERRRQEREQRK